MKTLFKLSLTSNYLDSKSLFNGDNFPYLSCNLKFTYCPCKTHSLNQGVCRLAQVSDTRPT